MSRAIVTPWTVDDEERVTCPRCKRKVYAYDGKVGQHGPDKHGDFICRGSGKETVR